LDFARGNYRQPLIERPSVVKPFDRLVIQSYDLIIRMTHRALDTKTRILDAAEKLFGDKGFDSTSLRDITTEADVNLASVNYHFQSKDSLIDAVIARRVEPINQKRREMLANAGASPTVKQILTAFLSPLIADQDVSLVAPLIGRILATPDVCRIQLFKKHMGPVALQFTAALSKALPDLSEGEVMWRLTFTAGAMAHIMARSVHIQDLTGGKCDPTDRPAVLARLVTFATAGFRAKEAH
jgi:AcrR family transcriptional regulator